MQTLSRNYCLLIPLMVMIAFPVRVSAQFEHPLLSSNLIYETKIHYGFLYAQHLELELFNAHFPAFEFTVEKQTYGKHPWERAFNYPITGVTFIYSGLGNNPLLGSSYSLLPFINFPLYKHKTFTLGFRFAIGLGYLTKRFDRVDNYKDIAIGSHINIAINLMLEARYRLNKYFTLTGGVSILHFSNGSLKTPNYGLNVPLINIGLACKPNRDNRNIGYPFIAPTEPFSTTIRRTAEFNIGVALGYKNMTSELGQNYLVYHLFENTFFRLNRISKVGIGLDLSYDESHKELLAKANDSTSNPFHIMRPGINGAYELILGRLYFILNLGFHLSGEYKSDGPFYEKICFQYNFTKNFFAHVLLVAHLIRADYIGWGFGYTFNVFYGKKKIR